MSDTSQGPGWWQAADGHWYPPRPADQPPAPGWWLATDGRWYPPRPADQPPAPGWWLATDGRWYPPAGARPVKKVVKKVLKKKAVAKKAGTPTAAPAPVANPATPATPATPAAPPAPAAAPTPPVAKPSPTAATAGTAPANTGGLTNSGKPIDPRGPVAPRPLRRSVAPPADSDDQIDRQRQASRDDAEQLATARYAAAMRALTSFTTEIEKELQPQADDALGARQERSQRVAGRSHQLDAPPPPGESLAAPPAAGAPTASPPSPTPAEKRPEPAPAPPKASPAKPALPPAAIDRPLQPLDEEPVLLELRLSPLGVDLDQIGDRVLVRSTGVEVRDRANQTRESIRVSDIIEVNVSRKLTGAALSVRSVTGQIILAKGVRPDLADEAKAVLRRLANLPEDRPERATRDPKPNPRREELVQKLTDLYNAGVLTSAEYEDKMDLIARLVQVEELTQAAR